VRVESTPEQVDRIGRSLFAFGSVATWHNFARLKRLDANAIDLGQTVGSGE